MSYPYVFIPIKKFSIKDTINVCNYNFLILFMGPLILQPPTKTPARKDTTPTAAARRRVKLHS